MFDDYLDVSFVLNLLNFVLDVIVDSNKGDKYREAILLGIDACCHYSYIVAHEKELFHEYGLDVYRDMYATFYNSVDKASWIVKEILKNGLD